MQPMLMFLVTVPEDPSSVPLSVKYANAYPSLTLSTVTVYMESPSVRVRTLSDTDHVVPGLTLRSELQEGVIVARPSLRGVTEILGLDFHIA